MIFAAGLGTRLRPLTDNKPKALIEVGGIPMIERVISRLKAAGVNEIVVNIHHLGQMITDFLQANDNFGCTIHISDESSRLLDTGGGILHARQWLEGNEPFIVHNADIITDMDLHDMYQHHVESGADATLLVDRRTTSRYLLLEADNRVKGWINTSTGETRPEGLEYDSNRYHPMAFGGIHVISPSVFTTLAAFPSNDGTFSIIPYYLSVCNCLTITGYTPHNPYRWCDIGKQATLAEACRIFGNS